jgi:surfeit locus 1 family protein
MQMRWRKTVVLLAAVVAMVVTARLGWWQLDRADTKTALAQQRQSQGVLPALSAADALALPLDATRHRPVVLTGRWVPEATVFLDNRPMQGKAGFVVATPLRVSGRSEVVLVQRGWVQRDFQDRNRLPALHTPVDDVEVLGTVAPPPSQLYAFDASEQGAIRQNIDLGAYSEETGLPLSAWSVLQTGPDDPQFQRAWPQPGVDVSKHHGYAFQWFALCALIGLLYVWFQLIAPLRARRS